MSAAIDFVAPPSRRFCRKCSHYHGGRAYGLCLVPACRCIRVDSVKRAKPRLVRPDDQVTARTRTRRSAQLFKLLTVEERQLYERASRHFDESDLHLQEFAAELGLDSGVLWRVRRSLRRLVAAKALGGGISGD